LHFTLKKILPNIKLRERKWEGGFLSKKRKWGEKKNMIKGKKPLGGKDRVRWGKTHVIRPNEDTSGTVSRRKRIPEGRGKTVDVEKESVFGRGHQIGKEKGPLQKREVVWFRAKEKKGMESGKAQGRAKKGAKKRRVPRKGK